MDIYTMEHVLQETKLQAAGVKSALAEEGLPVQPEGEEVQAIKDATEEAHQLMMIALDVFTTLRTARNVMLRTGCTVGAKWIDG